MVIARTSYFARNVSKMFFLGGLYGAFCGILIASSHIGPKYIYILAIEGSAFGLVHVYSCVKLRGYRERCQAKK